MSLLNTSRKHPVIYALALAILFVLATSVGSLAPSGSWQRAGSINFALGLCLLGAFAVSRLLAQIRIPWITGYILAGIALGPHGLAFLDRSMVADLKLIDDLAIGLIGLMAGAYLKTNELVGKGRIITLTTFFQTSLVFFSTTGFIILSAGLFSFTKLLPSSHVLALAVFAGGLAATCSPMSAIAIISECRAKGPFTTTTLGVVVVLDILVIVLFGAITVLAKSILWPQSAVDWLSVGLLLGEVMASIGLGFFLGQMVILFAGRGVKNMALFLLAGVFAVSKTAWWLEQASSLHLGAPFHIEPLLLCLGAGFWVQNRSEFGELFMANIKQFALPVFLLFFTMAGASLDLSVAAIAWPLALCIFAVRAAGIFGANKLAWRIVGGPALHSKNAWMAYITQAGVTIGLSQVIVRQVPEIGILVAPLIMCVVAANELIGPLAHKVALERTGEANSEG
jgi:Kef-type K+ transport system membrane component KefB